MAIWQQPPRNPYDLLVEYLNNTYPDKSISVACDLDKKITHLEINCDDVTLNTIVSTLKDKFPGAF